jgi:hypothetical protein
MASEPRSGSIMPNRWWSDSGTCGKAVMREPRASKRSNSKGVRRK